jgi:hypothetical protein
MTADAADRSGHQMRGVTGLVEHYLAAHREAVKNFEASKAIFEAVTQEYYDREAAGEFRGRGFPTGLGPPFAKILARQDLRRRRAAGHMESYAVEATMYATAATLELMRMLEIERR